MSKPLELIVYPQWRGYYREGDGSPLANFLAVDAYCRSKRLTDAELAAEYQNARLVSYVRHRRVENYPGDKILFDHYERGLEQEWFLERFATHPHYDEVRA